MAISDQTDGQLLQEYLRTGQESFFEELVQRHGIMVRGVCHRILSSETEAQDAAQAVFLNLHKKAASLVSYDSLGGWLYRTARFVALRSQRSENIRKTKEEEASLSQQLLGDGDEKNHELIESLEEEIEALPEKYRIPIVLHYLEGQTLEKVAETLGINLGAAGMRVARARDLLRQRLSRRGTALSAVALVGLLSQQTLTAVSSTFSADDFAQTMVSKIKKAGSPSAIGIYGAIVAFMTKIDRRIGMPRLAMLLLVLTGGSYFLAKWLFQDKETMAADTKSKKQIRKLVQQEKSRGRFVRNVHLFDHFKSIDDYWKQFCIAASYETPQERWRALRELGIHLSDQTFSEVEDYWDMNCEPDRANPNMKIACYHATIMSYWVRDNPQAALELVCRFLKMPIPLQCPLAFFPVVPQSYDGKDIFSAIFKGKTNSSSQDHLMSSLMLQWALQDAFSAQEWAEKLSVGWARQLALDTVFGVRSLSDPWGTIEATEKILNYRISDETLDVIFQIAVKKDFQKTLEGANQWSAISTRLKAIKVIGREWSEKNLDAAIKWVETLPWGKEREIGIHALAELNEGPLISQKSYSSAATVSYSSKKSPHLLFNWLLSLPEEKEGNVDQVLLFITKAMAYQDMDIAITQIQKVSRRECRIQMISSVSEIWASKDPESAKVWAEQLENSDEKKVALESIAHFEANKIPHAQIFPGIPYKAEVNGKMDITSEDGSLILRKILFSTEDGSLVIADESQIEDIVSHALSTIETLSLEDQQQSFREALRLVTAYQKDSIQKISEWLSHQPAGKSKDTLVTVYLKDKVDQMELHESLDLADQIKDDETWNSTVKEVFQRWLYRDREGTTQAIQESSLPQEMKEDLLNR